MRTNYCKQIFLFVLLSTLLIKINPSTAQTVPAGFKDSLFSNGWSEPTCFSWDSTGQMYVAEKAGYVWIVDTNGNKISTPLLDIHDEVGNWRDHGMGGFALDPNFRTNGYFYVYYTVDRHHIRYFGTASYSPGNDEFFSATIARLTRYKANSATNFTTLVPNSRLVLLGETKKTGVPVLFESHVGGQILFGRDNSLLLFTGDGSDFDIADSGSAPTTYYVQALADSIIRPEENCGSYRSQLLNCLGGKILRLDPATGNGLSSNPFYDGANPRSAVSRVYALGLRNPFRATIRPGTGSTDITAGNPGVIYIGDVQWGNWEELHTCETPGQNFGWPLYEGLENNSIYGGQNVENRDVLNPYWPLGSCKKYLQFNELLRQPTANGLVSYPLQCDNSLMIPSNIRKWLHSRPDLDWNHGSATTRTGTFTGNTASNINVGTAGSPVSGVQFEGFASVAGFWYTGSSFPPLYQNTYFHADYGAGWIKNFSFNAVDSPTVTRDFGSNLGPVVFLTLNPKNGSIYYINYPSEIRIIKYTGIVNNYPVAVATSNIFYGTAPLNISFTGSQSTDPEGMPLTYKWKFGDGDSSAVANPLHTFNAPANTPTTFTVTLTVTDNIGQADVKTLKIYANNTPPQITITSPLNNSSYSMSAPTNLQLNASVTDSEHTPAQLSYKWYNILHHNQHTHPESALLTNPANTVITPLGCGFDSYFYELKLEVTDAAGLSNSASSFIFPACSSSVSNFTVNNTTVCAGNSAQFTDLSTNLPTNYSWSFPGGTPSSSTLKNPLIGYNTPGTYSVTLAATNGYGGTPITKTNYITVTNAAPSASITPAGPTTFCSGGSVVFNANTGSGLTYQWRINGTNINGATLSSYTANTSGTYTVAVTNTCSTVISAGVIVTVGPATPATISGSSSFCAGSSNFLNSNTGTGISYQWYRNGGILTGATASSYNANSNGTYYVVQTSSCGNSQSNSIIVTQINNPSPSISYSTPLSFCPPGNVVLTSNTFSGIQYQWQKNSVDIAGATQQNYTVTSNGSYKVKQTANGCYKTASAVATTLATTVSAAIVANGPITFCSGGSVVLLVSNAIPGYSYQWKRNNTNISNATQSSYTATTSGTYVCVIAATCGSATSNSIVVSTGAITATITPSGTVNICSGATAVLNANTGTGYTFQWKLNGNNIAGATQALYNATNGGNYTVAITSQCGSSTSASTTVGISAISASVTPAGTATICAGLAQTFTANSGYNYSYQWYRNGIAQPGATNQNYSNSSNGNYSVAVSQGTACSASSVATTLNVTNNPIPSITPQGPTSFCSGQSVVLSSNTFAGVNFQWQKNSIDIAGATLQNYTASSTGSYKVKQTANGCYKTAPAVSVSVNCRQAIVNAVKSLNKPSITVSPNPFNDETLISVLSLEESFYCLEIINVLGKKVKTINLVNSSAFFKKENLPAGIYFVKCVGNKNSVLISKIIIE